MVIPAFNEAKLLGRTMAAAGESSGAFAARGWTVETVVCDNNSTDGTGAIAAAAGARVVFEPVNQISRARNQGASIATGDWLIFIDADSCPSREIFERVAENIESGACIGGGCLVKLDEDLPAGARVVRLWNFVSRTMRWS